MLRAVVTLRARIMLALFIAASALFVGVSLSPLRSGFADAPGRGPSDIALYQAEIDRMRGGETYYAAAAEELRSRGYPTRSIFNWRTPLPMWLIARLPSAVLAQGALSLAAATVIFLAYGLITKEDGAPSGLLAVVLLLGALLPLLIDNLFLMTEFWSGILIALSALAYGNDRQKLGTLSGIAALLIRELALPYCVLCVMYAVKDRRKNELLTWGAGFAAYAVFYAFHLNQVLPLLRQEGVAQAHSWVQFGGAAFVVAVAQMNVWLLLLPQWVTAIYLSAALLGFATWTSPAGQRIALTAILYLALFSIVGQAINQYWGSMIAPLLCLGAARFPTSLATLLRSACRVARPASTAGVTCS
jgi:hypothetical protein